MLRSVEKFYRKETGSRYTLTLGLKDQYFQFLSHFDSSLALNVPMLLNISSFQN